MGFRVSSEISLSSPFFFITSSFRYALATFVYLVIVEYTLILLGILILIRKEDNMVRGQDDCFLFYFSNFPF